jgi:hypothetical protein
MVAEPVYAGMTHEVTFDCEPEELLVTTFGTASVEGLSAMARTVFADPRFRPPMKILIDHRGLDWREMSADDIRLRAERLLDEEADLLIGCRLAIVPHGTAEFGIVRMMWAHIETEIAFDLGIFATIEEARAWLSSARP